MWNYELLYMILTAMVNSHNLSPGTNPIVICSHFTVRGHESVDEHTNFSDSSAIERCREYVLYRSTSVEFNLWNFSEAQFLPYFNVREQKCMKRACSDSQWRYIEWKSYRKAFGKVKSQPEDVVYREMEKYIHKNLTTV
ncbi:hypothetical protein KIN20_037247 [Parelaphostrongylus tenuis]|uniref:Uncharacterized protein n=1 Tax=Parelaphostrongylus tenuis TaxID=148309 RepID=A0AAD5WL13_PARTN|nr:hypothetical protein KIN20_037247 [Parelaphostrongylus tenuis]